MRDRRISGATPFDDLIAGWGAGIQTNDVGIFRGPVSAVVIGDADYKFRGEDYAGIRGVYASGDLNHDGTSDIVVAAPHAQTGADDAAVYVYTQPFGAVEDFTTAHAVIRGPGGTYEYVSTVSTEFDFSGDGVDDLAIGFPRDDSMGRDTGSVLIFFGPVAGQLEPDDADVRLVGPHEHARAGYSLDGVADATAGEHPLEDVAVLVIEGEANTSETGAAVSRAGDVDGDGLSDLLIGASLWDPYLPSDDSQQFDTSIPDGWNDTYHPDTDPPFPVIFYLSQVHGAVYLVRGGATGTLPLADADAAFYGDKYYGRVGQRLFPAGDDNGDGYADFVFDGRATNDAPSLFMVHGCPMAP